jgi:hypothetical protein
LVGVAVKVAVAPAHMVVAVPEICTRGMVGGLIFIVITFEVTGPEEAQLKEGVMITLTRSPLTNVADVKVGALVPALTPFTCH